MATFIRYFSPGFMFYEHSVIHCPKGESASEYALAHAPESAHGFQLGKRTEDQVEPTWFDGVTWFKGEAVSAEEAIAEVKAAGQDASILEFNCKANGYTRLLKAPGGQYAPLGAGDTVL